MKISKDTLSKDILDIINRGNGPFETRELEIFLKGKSRVMILYRLNNLRGENLINGKQIGSGKGTWIWWPKSSNKLNKNNS
jgi:hypothetical protein